MSFDFCSKIKITSIKDDIFLFENKVFIFVYSNQCKQPYALSNGKPDILLFENKVFNYVYSNQRKQPYGYICIYIYIYIYLCIIMHQVTICFGIITLPETNLFSSFLPDFCHSIFHNHLYFDFRRYIFHNHLYFDLCPSNEICTWSIF